MREEEGSSVDRREGRKRREALAHAGQAKLGG